MQDETDLVHQIRHDPEPVEQRIGRDVAGCRRGIARYHEEAGDVHHAERAEFQVNHQCGKKITMRPLPTFPSEPYPRFIVAEVPKFRLKVVLGKRSAM